MCVLCKNIGHNVLGQLVYTHGNYSTAMKIMFCFSICAAVGERSSVRRSSAAGAHAQASSGLCQRTKWHQTFPLLHITSTSFVLYTCGHQ